MATDGVSRFLGILMAKKPVAPGSDAHIPSDVKINILQPNPFGHLLFGSERDATERVKLLRALAPFQALERAAATFRLDNSIPDKCKENDAAFAETFFAGRGVLLPSENVIAWLKDNEVTEVQRYASAGSEGIVAAIGPFICVIHAPGGAPEKNQHYYYIHTATQAENQLPADIVHVAAKTAGETEMSVFELS